MILQGLTKDLSKLAQTLKMATRLVKPVEYQTMLPNLATSAESNLSDSNTSKLKEKCIQ